MKYTIKGVKKTTLPTKAGGTWTKVEVKINEIDGIYELGNGFSKDFKQNLAAGTQLNGWIEKKPWVGRDGQTRYNNVLNGITVDYLYKILKKLHPDIDTMQVEQEVKSVKSDGEWEEAPKKPGDGFDSSTIHYPTPEEEGIDVYNPNW